MSAETRKLSSRPRLAVSQPPPSPPSSGQGTEEWAPEWQQAGGPQAEASPSQNSVGSSGCITHED